MSTKLKHLPIISITLLTFLINLIFGDEQSILDFRSNPLGISEKEGIFPVKLGNYTNKHKIMAYLYYNEDK